MHSFGVGIPVRTICGIAINFFVCAMVFAGPINKPWDAQWEKARTAEAQGGWPSAEQAYKRTMDIAKASNAPDSIVRELKIKIATVYVHERKFSDAEPIYVELMNSDIMKPSNKGSASAREAIVLFDDLSDAYASSLENRETCLKHALLIKQKIFSGRDEDRLLPVLSDLALFYSTAQRFADAEPILKEKTAILEKEAELQKKVSSLGGLDSGELVRSYIQLSSVELSLKHYPEYEASCKKGYQLALAAFGPKHMITVSFAQGMVASLVRQGKFNEALTCAKIATQGNGGAEELVADCINQLAIEYKTEHKYAQGKQLELRVLQMANGKPNFLTTEVFSAYLLLGMSAAAEGNSAESQKYFDDAIKEAAKVKRASDKQNDRLRIVLESLKEAIWRDRLENKFGLAEVEYKQLLEAEQIIFANPLYLEGTLTRLAAVLEMENKYKECEGYLRRCISLGRNPGTYVDTEMFSLYLRLGICQSCQHKMNEANVSFDQALKAEKNKTGFHTGLILLRWGSCLSNNGRHTEASEKLNQALKVARALPPAKRGTLLSETLEALSGVELHFGKEKEARSLHAASLAEAQSQQHLDVSVTQNKYGGYNVKD